MKKHIENIDLKLDDYFEVAFDDKLIPTNSFIDKSKTGLGMTYSEFHADRHSIIVIPSLQIIEDKCKSYKYKKPISVWDEISVDQVKSYISKNTGWLKIVCTPEAFKKIVDAAVQLDKLDWLYKEVFCLLDEAHCYACDAFRKGILTPFRYFWRFKRKAVGSATPYPFTDKRFNDLMHYKIRYKESFGKITIVDHAKPMDVLHYFLTNPSMFKGRVHIFFNSVKEIARAIENANLKDVNVYCRADEKNTISLGDAAIYYRERPEKEMFKKFNFYSCKYNEGWDLYDDENTTMILVTDTKVAHSLVGIQYKGFQAVGRLRSDKKLNGKPLIIKPDMIYHITDTLEMENKDVRSFEYIRDNWYAEAYLHVKYYNLFKDYINENGFVQKDLTKILIKPLSILKNGVAEVYPMKVDQLICNEHSMQGYSNYDTIASQWQERNYETELRLFDIPPIQIRDRKRSDVNRDIVGLWEKHRLYPETYRHGIAERSIQKLYNRYKNLHSAYLTFGIDGLENLGYNDKEILGSLIELNNSNARDLIKPYLAPPIFTKGERYTRGRIKEILNELYAKFEVKKSNGQRKKATAEDLIDFGFEIKAVDMKVDGKRQSALLILEDLDLQDG